jgi:hypothetical protein
MQNRAATTQKSRTSVEFHDDGRRLFAPIFRAKVFRDKDGQVWEVRIVERGARFSNHGSP